MLNNTDYSIFSPKPNPPPHCSNDDLPGVDSVERFMHFIITKIRNIGTATIILAVDEEKSNKLVSVIAQFCDKVVKV